MMQDDLHLVILVLAEDRWQTDRGGAYKHVKIRIKNRWEIIKNNIGNKSNHLVYFAILNT